MTDGNVSSFTLEELSIGQPGVAYQIIADASVQPAGWKLDASLDGEREGYVAGGHAGMFGGWEGCVAKVMLGCLVGGWGVLLGFC